MKGGLQGSFGRVTSLLVPAAEQAVTVHHGPQTDIDVTYGALGAYATEHELAVDGPVREYYPVDARSTDDQAQWRTEIGWSDIPDRDRERHPMRNAGETTVRRNSPARLLQCKPPLELEAYLPQLSEPFSIRR